MMKPLEYFFYGMDTYGVSNRVQNWKPSPYEALSFYYMYKSFFKKLTTLHRAVEEMTGMKF